MQTENTAAVDNDIEGQIIEVKPDNALVVMNPEKYATELFEPFFTELTTAKRKAARTTYDVRTKDGMATAKEFRAMFIKLRTRADKAKTEAKRPIDQAGKAILARFGDLKLAAEAEEAKHNKAISDEEARLEAEKQRKIEEQRVRTEEIQNRIGFIRNIPGLMAQSTSEVVSAKLEEMSAKRLDPAMYDEHLEDAVNALNSTIDQLRALHQQALAREEAAALAEANRIELERLRAEKADADRRAAAEASAQAEVLAAAQRQRDQMAQIMELQGLASRTSDRESIYSGLRQARKLDISGFGDLTPMAEMTRDMVLQKLESALACLPDEVAPPVKELDPVQDTTVFITATDPIPSEITDKSVSSAPKAEPSQTPAIIGPSDDEIIDVVADYFSWTHATARARLAKIKY